MRVVALDTTTRAGSVALVEDDRIVSERAGDPSRTHAERLPGEILALLDACGRTTADVDLFAAASGPGSFTGLRIGIATVQGLAFVHRRQIVAISALEALAQIASVGQPAGAVIGPWMDAQRGEVFTALYRVVSPPLFHPNRLSEIESPAVGDPVLTLRRWAAFVDVDSAIFVGDGAVRYADVIGAATGPTNVSGPSKAGHDVRAGDLLAGAIGLMAAGRAALGEKVEPAGVRPLYVRRPDAEIDREQRALTTKDTKERSG